MKKWILGMWCLVALSAPAQEAILKSFADLAKADSQVVEGKDGWLYFRPELRALSVGPFWGDSAAKVSRSSNPKYVDPLAAIVDFDRQLKKAGIEWLLVPVPAKASIYPEPLVEGSVRKRIDMHHAKFYEQLNEKAIPVLDVHELFRAHRDDPQGPVYCKTDTHWSGYGLELVAKAIAERVEDKDWLRNEASRRTYVKKTRDIRIKGDLSVMKDADTEDRETLKLTFVGEKMGDMMIPLDTWRASPVLLMGDSHTLVFHDPQLHDRGAGLPDQLALQFGFPVDLVGVMASGSTATRITLLRRKDNLEGKKFVIWCFSMREFTESTAGWRVLPVIR